jgi:hypothetical protein
MVLNSFNVQVSEIVRGVYFAVFLIDNDDWIIVIATPQISSEISNPHVRIRIYIDGWDTYRRPPSPKLARRSCG